MAATGLAIAPAPQEESWAHFAVIQGIQAGQIIQVFRVIQRVDAQGGGLPAQTQTQMQTQTERDLSFEWQMACWRLTRRVEHLSPTRALLDLGTCTDAEALGTVQRLLAYLATRDIPARAGIAPSGCLAELALLRAPAHVTVRLIGRDEAAELLYRTPVDLLPRLSVAGIAGEISPAVVERLQTYGLRTLGQVGRLGELALRRQFGAQIGSLLAAIATGHDPRPLSPTPSPASLRVRLRVPGEAIAPEQVPVVLAHFAEQVAQHLCDIGRQVRTLHLAVLWETGARQQCSHTLRQPTHDAALLLDALQRLLLPLLAPGCSLTDLHLTLLDFAPVTPEQAAFWRTHTQRLAVLEGVADTLARRHGKPLLLCPQLVAPDAIFPENRHALTAADTNPADRAMVPTHQAHPDAEPHPPRGTSSQDAWDAWDAWQDVPQRLHWW